MTPLRLATLATALLATPVVAQQTIPVANAVPECPAFDIVVENVLALYGGAATATASATPPPGPGTGEPVAAEIIFDASGSMAAAMGSERKIDAARRALAGALAKLDGTDAMVSVRAYGFDTTVAKTPEASCPNTALVSGFGAKAGIQHGAAVNGLQPYGYTPIAASLTAAGVDLAGVPARERMIILITDGEETCDGDPVAAARALASAGIDVATHVVGFDLNAAQRAEMQAIAKAGSGAYFDATDARALESAIDQAVAVTVRKSERRIEKCDNRVVGGATVDTATPVGRGLYTVGEMVPRGEERFYSVDAAPGETVRIRGLLQSHRWIVGNDGRPFETAYALGAMTLRTYDAAGRAIGGRAERARDVPGTTLERAVTVEGDGVVVVSVGDNYDPVAPDTLFAIDILDAGGKPVQAANNATASAPSQAWPGPSVAESSEAAPAFNFYAMSLDRRGQGVLGQGAPSDVWRIILPERATGPEGWLGVVSVLVEATDGSPPPAYEVYGEREGEIVALADNAGSSGHRVEAADGGRLDALIVILRRSTPALVPYSLLVYADG